MATAQSAEFKQAVGDSRKLKSKPSQDQLLKLYALFKQGSQDPPIDKADKVGMFDLKEKAKRKAWQEVADEKLSPEDAQQKYVALVNELKATLGFEG